MFASKSLFKRKQRQISIASYYFWPDEAIGVFTQIQWITLAFIII